MLKTKYQQNHNRICNNPDCEELGIYPAPKSRDNLNEYYYFCIDIFGPLTVSRRQ